MISDLKKWLKDRIRELNPPPTGHTVKSESKKIAFQEVLQKIKEIENQAKSGKL